MTITKKRAFLIHLALSFLIFGSLVATLYFAWFPGDLFFLDGGWQGLKLVAMVDLVLGPALTLLLFSPGKKGLKFDMTAIAMVQIGALAYGFHTTYQQQTVALVFSEGGFNTVSYVGHLSANKKLIELGAEPKQVQQFGDRQPYNIYMAPPNGATMGRFLVDIFNGYPDPFERSDQYLKVSENHSRLQEKEISIEMLKEEGAWDTIKKTLDATDRDPNSVEFYRFKGRYATGFVVFSPKLMRIVDYVAFKRKKAKTTVQAESDK